MCLAVPAKVLTVAGDYAVVSVLGVEQEVNRILVPGLKPGHYVLVHAGFALERVDDEYLSFVQETLVKLLEADELHE